MTTKAQRKQAQAAVDSFHHHYASSANWGRDRWNERLYAALLRPTRYAALINQYAPSEAAMDAFAQAGIPVDSLKPIEVAASASSVIGYERRDVPDADRTNECPLLPAPSVVSVQGSPRLTHWNLDAASVQAACLLQVEPGDRVLDLCAAPGGKSVTLAQQIWPHLHHGAASARVGSRMGSLHSNEVDGTRNRRLAFNLRAYLPPELFDAHHVQVLRVDGSQPNAVSQLPHGAGGYDKVLVDAPCSSERHLIHAQARAERAGQVAEEMARWRPGSSKTLAKTQAALVMTALRAVRVGGRVVYATCSLETAENDGVVDQVLAALEKEGHKRGGLAARVLAPEPGSTLDGSSEATRHGRITLPDHPSGGGWGPLFSVLLLKTAG